MDYKLAIVTPILIQNDRVLNLYLSNVNTYKSSCKTKIFAICNKLYISDKTLLDLISNNILCSNISVQVLCDKERSVAGAWNKGIKLAMNEAISQYHILSQDVALHPKCIDNLIKDDLPIVSSVDNNNSIGQNHKFHSCDFSSVMIKKEIIDKFGWFDKEYKPAYYEDNDYVIRLILNGHYPFADCSAIHYTPGSATIKLDSEAAHHAHHWGGYNKQRYLDKWGQLFDNYEDIRTKSKKNPFGQEGKPVSWWPEQLKEDYDVAGGIHE